MDNFIKKLQTGGKSAFIKLDSSLSDNKKMTLNKIAPMVKSQADWTGEYINSPMYKERLMRQAASEKKILAETAHPMTEAGKFLSNGTIFGGNQAKWQNKTIADNIIRQNNAQLNHLGNNNIKVGNFSLGLGIGGEYEPNDNKIYMPEGVLGDKDGALVAAHELSHGVNRSNEPYSTGFRDRYVEGKVLNRAGDQYVQRPTEVKARLDAMRYKMKQNGYYDASTQKFDASHLQQLKNDKSITNDVNYKSLDRELKSNNKDNSLMWLFNNIAKTKQQLPVNDQMMMARNGGTLKNRNTNG